MGIQYIVANFTKKEIIGFKNLISPKKEELAGSSVISSIVCWYMLKNIGDYISLIPDQFSERDWHFPVLFGEIIKYNDVTDKVIEELFKNEILEDKGILYQDEDNPDIYIRDLKNIWED